MSDERQRLPSQREVALVELLDRALGAGVVIAGDVTLTLADIDLVDLSLRLVVGSVPTLRGPAEQRAQDPEGAS
ncbi:MAG: gas vesicle protein [Actinobacteria bacterium]|nr:gas vesicle protein [Actinomycetota bacterium]